MAVPLTAAQMAEVAQQLQNAAPRRPASNALKLMPHSSNDPSEWLEWLDHFDNLRRVKRWTDLEASEFLVGSLRGKALAAVRHVNCIGKTCDQIRADFNACFVTASASRAARTNFKNARQTHGEDVTVWHSRLRSLFILANPELAAENSRELVEHFIDHLADPDVRFMTRRVHPESYIEAKEVAQVATADKIAARADGLGGRRISAVATGAPTHGDAQELGLHAMSGGGGCWECGSSAHYRRDCPTYQPPSTRNSGRRDGPRQGRGRGRPRQRGQDSRRRGSAPSRGRGGRSGNGGGGRRMALGINSLAEAITEAVSQMSVEDSDSDQENY